MSEWWNKRHCAAAAGGALLMAGVSPAMAANPQVVQEPTTSTLFSDSFSGGFGNWIVGTNTIDHTIFGQTPTLVTNATGGVSTYARFKLDTYDPAANQGGVSFLGTQLQTKLSFALPTSGGVDTGQGIQFQVTARVEATGATGPAGNASDGSITTAQGLNAANFSYSYNGGSANYHDEIDFENLTSQQTPPTVANPTGKTGHSSTAYGTSNGDATLDTSYATAANGGNDSSQYSQAPYKSGDLGPAAQINIYHWHTYDIDWFPNQIDWYVDGALVREEAPGETNGGLYIPNEPMAYYLNFWAPGSDFSDAYSSSLLLASNAAANQEFYYDTADTSVNVLAPLGTPVPEPTAVFLLGSAGVATLLRRRRSS